MLSVLLPFTAYHWYISVKGLTSLEICRDDLNYTPSTSYSHNVKLIYGTSNIFICLLPRVNVNRLWGCYWPSG